MSTLGFDSYVEPLKLYLQKFREVSYLSSSIGLKLSISSIDIFFFYSNNNNKMASFCCTPDIYISENNNMMQGKKYFLQNLTKSIGELVFLYQLKCPGDLSQKSSSSGQQQLVFVVLLFVCSLILCLVSGTILTYSSCGPGQLSFCRGKRSLLSMFLM